jgi:signal recognition particle receptor subunit beta
MPEHALWEDLLTWMFSPNWSTIILAVIVAFTLPVLIHGYLYKKAVAKEVPRFLLMGPSGAGKTSLLTLVYIAASPSRHHLLVLC